MTQKCHVVLLAIAFAFSVALVTDAQDREQTSFDISNVYQSIDGRASLQTGDTIALANPWWDRHVSKAQRNQAQTVPTNIHSLMYLALKNSNQIKVAADNPVIRETAITEADSEFDWVKYLETSWNDTNEPVSTSLEAGGAARFLNDHQFSGAAGIRRKNRNGGELDISQRAGWQDNNSTFFLPGNQATGQLTVSYTHPLMRGNGVAYNNSLVVLAQLDAATAMDEFQAELQNHLLEVARAYWLLYQERAILAQQVRLYLKTEQILATLQSRQQIDAQRTQLITASSALESRRSDLIRARTAVVNAETRLRGLISAPELSNADIAEMVPVEFPSLEWYDAELLTELEIAIQNRPEIKAAIKQVRSGATRLGVAKHEMMPVLNLVTRGYLSGLRGNSDFAQALGDQFSEGAPSYSIGLQYEMPIGNRLARSRLTRRRVELRQLQVQYDQALEAVQTEIDIAVRELHTAYREIQARSRALAAAEAEARTIEMRWKNLIDGSGSSALNLESLLRAQERVTEAERAYVTSMLAYNVAMIYLKKTNGTLLQSENVVINKSCDSCNGPSLQLNKYKAAKQINTSSISDSAITENGHNVAPPQVYEDQYYSDQ